MEKITRITEITGITGRLENWVWDERGIYWGNIYEDSRGRFNDGTWIHTSLVKKEKKNRIEGDLVKTLNSIYILGKPGLKNLRN